MITIRKGNRVLSIPSGAYKTYASAGWVRAEEDEVHSDKDENLNSLSQEPDLDENPKSGADPEQEKPLSSSNSEGDNDTEGDEDEEDVIYVDPEELKERPLSELDNEELQILAEYMGIDTEEIKTSKALRAELKKVL